MSGENSALGRDGVALNFRYTAVAFAAFACLAAGCSGGDSNSEPKSSGTTPAAETGPKPPKSPARFPDSTGSIVLREKTGVARRTPRTLPGSFGELSIEVAVRVRGRTPRAARVSVACVGPGQGQTYEFLVVPRTGAYVIRERDEDEQEGFPFDLQNRTSKALRRKAFKLQVLCKAGEPGTGIISGDSVILAEVTLGVDGRIVTNDLGIDATSATPWDKIAVNVRPPRSGLVLEDLVVRG